MFGGSVDKEALQTAQKATVLTRNSEYNSLHTLASIHAELGNTTEAREILLHGMQVGGIENPDPACWYVFARIAEQLDEREAALSAYKKVTAPEGRDTVPTDVVNLARKRVRILLGPGK